MLAEATIRSTAALTDRCVCGPIALEKSTHMKEKNTNANKQKKAPKRNARIICQNKTEFWTTQKQFWQWVRDLKVVKLNDYPLTGAFAHPHEESMIVLCNMVLNGAHRNHVGEVLSSRRLMKSRRA